MLIRIGYEIVFDVPSPTAMLLMLYAHPSRESSFFRQEKLHVSPSVPVQKFVDAFGNVVGRVLAPAGQIRFWNDGIVQDSGDIDAADWFAQLAPVEELPTDVMQFLLASRYCEVDLFTEIAWQLFGTSPTGWARVAAINKWVHENVEFGYQHARPTKTAMDVYRERKGVCRDFMHLCIAFCRAMNIPARYATGYLGDIGVPVSASPMDFSAWYEVFLGGRWWTWDGRHDARRIGRVLMATGRDAVDCALTTSFGDTNLVKFNVWTDEIKDGQIDKPAPFAAS